MLQYEFGNIIDIDEGDVETVTMKIDTYGQGWIWSTGTAIAVFPGVTSCDQNFCKDWPITITLTDAPTDPDREDDPLTTTYDIFLKIKSATAIVEEAEASGLIDEDTEVIDSTGENSEELPPEETVTTISGETVVLDGLTEQEKEQKLEEIEEEKQTVEAAVDSLATIGDALSSMGIISSDASTEDLTAMVVNSDKISAELSESLSAEFGEET